MAYHGIGLTPEPYCGGMIVANTEQFRHYRSRQFTEWRRRVRIDCGNFELKVIAIPRNEEPDPPYGQDVVEEKDYWSPRIQHYLRALCRVRAPLDSHGNEHEARSRFEC